MRDDYEARLVAAEIALGALLAEVEELRNRLEAHAEICPLGANEIKLT